MFEFITNREDRGQVGIGTLIVFIAMVLVAAIAAGVLINTAGFLQTQAEATGEESTDLVSERIDVTSEVGIVGSEANGELSEIRLSVSGAPGADQIDLSETTIQAVGPGGQQNLVFTDRTAADSVTIPPGDDKIAVPTEVVQGDTIQVGVSTFSAYSPPGEKLELTEVNGNATVTRDIGAADEDSIITIDVSTLDTTNNDIDASISGGNTLSVSSSTISTVTGNQQISELNSNQFAVGSDTSFESTPVLDDENDYTILINPDAGAFEDGSPFGEGQSATLDIVSPAGATTSVELRAPDLFNKDGEAVRL
jgi:flagellin FlaB